MAQYDLPGNKKRTELKAPTVTQTVPAPLPTPGDPRGLTPYILETAKKYGIDPVTALKVAKSEGLASFKSGVIRKDGTEEPSFGAFQLYTGGGLGNEFQKATGLDPSDPANERATIDFALKRAAQGGWGPWNGAKNTGIGQFEGIGTSPASTAIATASPMLDPAANTESGTAPPSDARVDTASTTTPGDDSTTSDEKTKDKKKKDYGDLAGDAVSDIGKLYAEGPVAKNAARASGPANIAAPSTPTAPGPIPMTDARLAEAQRQQLALAMQRLNSRRLY